MDETKINNIEENEMESTLWTDVKSAFQKDKERRVAKREIKKAEQEEARAKNPSFLGRHAGKIVAGVTGLVTGGVAGYHIAKQAVLDYGMEESPSVDTEVEAPVAETIE